jgi:hypothetical protein
VIDYYKAKVAEIVADAPQQEVAEQIRSSLA